MQNIMLLPSVLEKLIFPRRAITISSLATRKKSHAQRELRGSGKIHRQTVNSRACINFLKKQYGANASSCQSPYCKILILDVCKVIYVKYEKWRINNVFKCFNESDFWWVKILQICFYETILFPSSATLKLKKLNVYNILYWKFLKESIRERFF